jgi:SET domain
MRRLDTYAVLGASPHGEAVLAVQELAPGTLVFPLTGTLTHIPDTYTIQIGAHTHLLPDGQLWRYLNHSCAPNCRIDFNTWTLVTTRTIQCNEELTFNYLTTEWDMVAPFACQCGALHCYGCVAGFKYLPPVQQVLLAPQCSPILRRLWRAHVTSIPRAPLTGRLPEVHVFIPSFTGAVAFYDLTTYKVPMEERLCQHGIATPQLQGPLADLAIQAFLALSGTGYVLEANANCSLSSDQETSAGQILRLAKVPIHQLIASILEDALVRFQSTGQPQGHGQ